MQMKPLFKRGLLLCALFFGLLFPVAAQSTQVVVTLNDGTEQTYFMSEEDRMFFEDNQNLVIELLATKNVIRISLDDIRKITCHETESTAENAENPVSIFPNPVHDVLTLRNLQGKQMVSIYALDGRLTMSFEAIADQPMDIAELPVGLYLVKTQSTTLKMVKL